MNNYIINDNLVEIPYVSSCVEGCNIRICNENDQILQDGYIGEIQIKGENIFSDYSYLGYDKSINGKINRVKLFQLYINDCDFNIQFYLLYI